MSKNDTTIEVTIESLSALAAEAWRLSRWLESFVDPKQVVVGRHVARKMDNFLAELEFTVLDVAGRTYEPGLSVEVLDTIEDPTVPEGEAVVDETVDPIVLWRQSVVRLGKVVTRASQTPRGNE